MRPRWARSGADVLVAAEHVGRVPGALEGDQAVVLGWVVGAADARLVEEVWTADALDGLDIGPTISAHGSGGMRTKVGAAEMAAMNATPTHEMKGLLA